MSGLKMICKMYGGMTFREGGKIIKYVLVNIYIILINLKPIMN
jgi:hypothetical protein